MYGSVHLLDYFKLFNNVTYFLEINLNFAIELLKMKIVSGQS